MENKNLFSIEGKVIIITGGCGILGTDMATYLASQGAKVVILDRAQEKGDKLVKTIKNAGGEAHFLRRMF